ncbi:MAG TPA: Re/Si-specific NAD(P)(+) transhydrogenase subunit alpha [Thermoanaerobaculia bacterium]|jgi:NAD(P) transhydrogenase subunit alpha|nr:MAG: NAD(P) transhydrogenase subunit alpha part 1 [Acidobacteria bacterium ADurb.Bin051]HNU82148.1 Re/Si-specific NAD(P)(+) transhydrogenase subunit alpha [Thermoanaerobaculia bacterium]
MLNVFVPKESRPGERRVAATPDSVKRLLKAGLAVQVEREAGFAAGIPDDAYAKAGATVAAHATDLWRHADIVLKVAPLGSNPSLGIMELEALKPGAVLIGFLDPFNLPVVRRYAERRITTVSMELVPRITRAQVMDALSSQASVAGYRAVLIAATRVGKYFPLMTTAAGTVTPARVVVLGAGVAGLQAVATARRLGAVVEVSDIRPAVKEQVESLGGRFIDLPLEESGEGSGGYARELSKAGLERQREVLTRHLAQADVVITTAQVPGKRAPILVTTAMAEQMKPGAVIVDIAAEQGGNCELTRADETVEHRGLLVLGPTNLAAGMAGDASVLYARNVAALLLHFVRDGELAIDPADEVLASALLTHQGEVINRTVAGLLAASRG